MDRSTPSRRRAPLTRKPQINIRLTVEQLEDRRVMSVARAPAGAPLPGPAQADFEHDSILVRALPGVTDLGKLALLPGMEVGAAIASGLYEVRLPAGLDINAVLAA